MGIAIMKYYLDTEFIEDGETIDLISIGIVADDEREYYAISTDFDPRRASQWVKDNVLSKLPFRHPASPTQGGSPRAWEESLAWKPRHLIRDEVAEFLGYTPDVTWYQRRGLARVLDSFFPLKPKIEFELRLSASTPEIWADYASYDWIALCQLFGTMMDLPKGMPMYCNDIQQYRNKLGVHEAELPQQAEGQHNALADARHCKVLLEFLEQ